MKKELNAGFFAGCGETQTPRVVKGTKKTGRVDRLGETGPSFKNPLSAPSPHFSPFSPLAQFLQAQHAIKRQALTDASIENVKTLPSRGTIEEYKTRPLFQLVFLSQDEDQSVEVKEVQEVDFEELKTRLERGESVFITTKGNEKIELIELDKECEKIDEKRDRKKPWYIRHF